MSLSLRIIVRLTITTAVAAAVSYGWLYLKQSHVEAYLRERTLVRQAQEVSSFISTSPDGSIYLDLPSKLSEAYNNPGSRYRYAVRDEAYYGRSPWAGAKTDRDGNKTMYSDKIASWGRASEALNKLGALSKRGAPYFAIGVDKLDARVMEEECRRNGEALRELCPDIEITNFCYPFGRVSLPRKRQLEGRFDSCRGIYEGINAGIVDLALLRVIELNSKVVEEVVEEG